jgi:DNA-directed RNA polymerase subunit RPC12/RpoP
MALARRDGPTSYMRLEQDFVKVRADGLSLRPGPERDRVCDHPRLAQLLWITFRVRRDHRNGRGKRKATETMPNTDDTNTVAGLYACTSCGKEITMPDGHKFPPCSKCGGTSFRLVTATPK